MLTHVLPNKNPDGLLSPEFTFRSTENPHRNFVTKKPTKFYDRLEQIAHRLNRDIDKLNMDVDFGFTPEGEFVDHRMADMDARYLYQHGFV